MINKQTQLIESATSSIVVTDSWVLRYWGGMLMDQSYSK